MGEMSCTLDDLDPSTRHGLAGDLDVTGRQHGVTAPPHHAGGHVQRQVGTIRHRDHLPAPVDNGPQHMEEGIALLRVLFAGEH